MAVAGIDMGAQSTKVVILEGDRILAAVTLKTGESGETEARQAMDEALRQAQLKPDDLRSVVATGVGRMNAPFAQKRRSTMSCLAGGAHFLYPQPRTVIDAGAESPIFILHLGQTDTSRREHSPILHEMELIQDNPLRKLVQEASARGENLI